MSHSEKNVSVDRAKQEYRHQMRLGEIQAVLDVSLADVPAPKILEAGCGSASHYDFKPNSEIVGIDISQDQLERNETLSRKILGDIQTYDLSKFSFDAIICHFIMEHINDPEKALSNFVQGLSDKGVIIIVAPNLFSLQGISAKLTPFWFHRFVHRMLLQRKQMDATSRHRFPTPFRLSMTPRGLRSFAKRNGLEVQYFHVYEGWGTWVLKRQSKLAMVLLRVVQAVVKIVTLGQLDILLGTYAMILGRRLENHCKPRQWCQRKLAGIPKKESYESETY